MFIGGASINSKTILILVVYYAYFVCDIIIIRLEISKKNEIFFKVKHA